MSVDDLFYQHLKSVKTKYRHEKNNFQIEIFETLSVFYTFQTITTIYLFSYFVISVLQSISYNLTSVFLFKKGV